MRMKTLDDQQRAALLDRLYRRISRLDDDSLIELDRLTAMADPGTGPQPAVRPPTQPTARPVPIQGASAQPVAARSYPDHNSRRLFLVTLVAGTVLAAGAGGAATLALTDERVRQWLIAQGWLPPETAAIPTALPGPTTTLESTAVPTLPAGVRNQLSALQKQVDLLTSERDQLRKQVQSLGGQVQDANGQIDQLKGKNGDLSSLIDLYKQLDVIDLDALILSSLTALGVPILAIDTVRTALKGGTALAVRVLQGVEDQIPLVRAGLDWLDKQVLTISAGYRALQTALEISDDSGVAKRISDFISQVLDMLPFGVGQNVKVALQAVGNVMSQLPELLNNVRVMVIQPTRAWVGTGNTGGLYDSLLKPIREQVLAPAQQIVANAENLNTVYNKQVAQPVQTALDQRAKVRIEIIKKVGALT
jgi:hypothetical protein